jgi:general stress protein 26
VTLREAVNMSVPTGKDLAKAVDHLSALLIENELVEDQSAEAFSLVASQLRRNSTGTSWGYEVDRSTPVLFRPVDTRKLNSVQPQLHLNVCVGNSVGKWHPFVRLATTLELLDEQKSPIMRWHVDLANTCQQGPMFHLQAGGHSQSYKDRSQEIQIELPRWAHPPVDLFLACELVVANFYPEKWLQIRALQGWCDVIRDAEKFCYLPYQEEIKNYFSTSGRPETLLHRFWIG